MRAQISLQKITQTELRGHFQPLRRELDVTRRLAVEWIQLRRSFGRTETLQPDCEECRVSL